VALTEKDTPSLSHHHQNPHFSYGYGQLKRLLMYWRMYSGSVSTHVYWAPVAFWLGGDGGRKSPEHQAPSIHVICLAPLSGHVPR
jgi:hypothetical protein